MDRHGLFERFSYEGVAGVIEGDVGLDEAHAAAVVAGFSLAAAEMPCGTIKVRAL